jgi:hypothetical protein
MANLKITELPVLATIQEDSPFAVVDLAGPTTSQVTVTGMTFLVGQGSQDSLVDIPADPSSPFLIQGDGTEFLFTATTSFDIKRYEANSLVSVMVTYKTSGGSIGDISYFRADVGGNNGPQIYLPDTAGAWNSVSITHRSSGLVVGVQAFDLYMNLANGVNFEFAQVYLFGTEL